ncbi:MAG: hypothetical protein AVDCRST_MAG39-2592, partial [uncultured Sphingomonadaceae bacterium]
ACRRQPFLANPRAPRAGGRGRRTAPSLRTRPARGDRGRVRRAAGAAPV